MGEGYNFGEALQVSRPTYGVLPVGSYTVSVESADQFARTRYDGSQQGGVSLKYIVIDQNDHRGRALYESLTLEGTSEKAIGYALSRIKNLAWACGLSSIQNTNELVGKICSIDVDIEKREGFDPRNKIVRYKKYEVPVKQEETTEEKPVEDDLSWE